MQSQPDFQSYPRVIISSKLSEMEKEKNILIALGCINSKEKQPEEGIDICVESIERLKEVEGVRGFHVMAIEWEEMVPEIVKRGGLYPRPNLNG